MSETDRIIKISKEMTCKQKEMVNSPKDVKNLMSSADKPPKSHKPGNSGNCLPPGPGPGKPKGYKHKVTALINDLLESYQKMGGIDYLIKMSKSSNPTMAKAYTALLAKVMPNQVNLSMEEPISMIIEHGQGDDK